MATSLPNLLGVGLYTPSEAALYARIRAKTMARWIYGDSQGEPVITAQLGHQTEKFVSFLDFVQSLAIRSIRAFKKVPLQRIRNAVVVARDKYKVEHPLAQDHRIFLSPNNDVIIRLGDSEADEQFVQVTGKKKHNLLMGPIIEPFLKDLNFDPDGIATLYKAWTKHQDTPIVMNPQRHFGEPILPSGYSALSLFEAYKSEGNGEVAARAYGVDPKEISVACEYYDYLLGNIAA